MPDPHGVFDDDRAGRARPLDEHEQRRLDDIAAWLDLTDARFGARMRRLGPRPPRRVDPPRDRPRAGGNGPGTDDGSERRRPAIADPGPGGGEPMDQRSWNRLVQVATVLTVALILLSAFLPGPWAVLAISMLATFVPLLVIAIYALRLPAEPDPHDTSS